MYCKNCGNEVNEIDKFCRSCGASIFDERISNVQPNQKVRDATNFGYAILGCFIPLVGIILYFVWRNEYPLRAKSCLRGVLVCVAFYVVVILCVIASINNYRYY